jgi:hypothetical protein
MQDMFTLSEPLSSHDQARIERYKEVFKDRIEAFRRLNGKYLREAEELLAKKDYPG